MKKILFIAIIMVIIACLIIPASGLSKAQLPTAMKKVTPRNMETIRLDVAPLTKMSIEYSESDLSDDIIIAIQQVFGAIPKNPHVTVKSNGKLLALIPIDSKFVELEPHEYCLELQYGTDAWYKCEKRLLDDEKRPKTGKQLDDGSFVGEEIMPIEEEIGKPGKKI